MPIDFEPSPTIDFQPDTPSIDFRPDQVSSVAQMASATKEAVGVVGRAVAASDLAISNKPIGDSDSYETQLADATGQSDTPEPVTVWERGKQVHYPSREAASAALSGQLEQAQSAADAFRSKSIISLPTADLGIAGPSRANAPAGLQVAAGAYNALKAVPEFFGTELGAGLIASGNLPALAHRLIAAGFTVDLALHTPEQIMALAKAVQSGDRQAIGEAATSLGLNLVFTGLSAKTALTKVAPITAEAVAKVAPIETKPAEPLISAEPLKESLTPLTAEAVKAVREPVPPPAPTPAAVASELGKPAPVPAGVEPPAKLEVAQIEQVAKLESERALTTPKWTTATRAGAELGAQTLAGIPDPIATVKAAIALAKEASPWVKRAGEAIGRVARTAGEGVGEFVGEQMSARKMTDYRRSVLNWSSRLQQSFGEADSAQREIRRTVPDAVRREGITNWIQANGDAEVLKARADATIDPKLKAGYEAALALAPEELAVANDVRMAFEELGQRGQTYDVLNSFKENYVTQTWDLGRGPAAGGSRTLKEKFRFSKASSFATYFDGEQAGYVPKTKDISKLLPMYLHEMNSVIAARQLVQEMAGGVGSDGRPLLTARGGGVPVGSAEGKATLIMPDKVQKDTGDYKVLENQPALTDWRWASKDTDGNPIFLKADLALHPEAYDRLKDVLGKSAIREWYQTRTTAAAQIPKLIVKAIDVGQGETKRTMLGFFAPFHQVQEGTHAVGHRVNPFFSIPKIDLVKDAGQVDATKHGLMLLPDRTSAEQFIEGFRHSGLVSMIPKIGPAADWYSHYLFQEYIPGLKYKTYEHILERNSKVYEKELKSGEVKLEDIKLLSAEQSNAAYGHLNYADLARNQTVLHAARLFLLAPDFFEARARFTAQGIKGLGGAKVGREQILALATLAIAQTATAWIAAETTGGQWDAKHPFEMVHGDRRYSMRSVPEDIAGLLTDSRKFVYSRISPIIGKGLVQGLSGVDYKGDKVTAGDTAKELAQSPIPLPLRGFLGTSQRNLNAFEELAGSVGLRISRYLPEPVMHSIQLRDNVDLWINRSKKLDKDDERARYLMKQLEQLSTSDRQVAVTRIKQRTSKGVRAKVR